jgi:hypothetical protein
MKTTFSDSFYTAGACGIAFAIIMVNKNKTTTKQTCICDHSY